MVSKNFHNYRNLLEAVNRSRIDVYDDKTEEVIETKRRHLRSIFHYTSLNWIDGKKMPIEEAPAEMIHKAYLGHYRRAQKEHSGGQGFLFDVY